ncbi:hypothetical protein J2W56_002038 [Nocardia kruczakiae]|uniref:Uncharacterized protein n=1 Tax=Nocardia kruczakiae TaxID=261477 RepID=A0ABU1XCN6_9NOCA|nr:hypothetical protein [Nocardia kruczakiae]MDR7168307.1 hypothetical protein [Nocardia kruczakiae]
MRLVSSGRHHAAFEFGELQVISLRDGYIDMPPTRLREEHGCALAEQPAAVPLVGPNLWGDTVHVPTLQFDRPAVSWELDGNQSQARAARAALLERLTRPHHLVAGAHLDSPGIARVTPAGAGYALEYLAPPIG